MKSFIGWFLAATALVMTPVSAATKGAPSRAAQKDCTWEKLGDASFGLEAWAQRCDFGSRKVDLFIAQKSIVQRFSDGGAPEPLIDVIELQPGETATAGIQRVFEAHTDKALAARCKLAPYHGDGVKTPAGVKRYTFVPNAAYQKEVDAKSSPDEVGDPACGDYGDAPDGIQYFETQPTSGAKRILFVRVGQDEPLFDEQTLRLLPAP